MNQAQEEEASQLIGEQLAGLDETVTLTTASLAIVLRLMFVRGAESEKLNQQTNGKSK